MNLQDESFTQGRFIKGKRSLPLEKKKKFLPSLVFEESAWGPANPTLPPVSSDSRLCSSVLHPSWINEHWPIFIRMTSLLNCVGLRCWNSMVSFSDFLQCRFLPQGWEAITTIPVLLNTFLLPKLREVKIPDFSVQKATA